MAEHGQGGSLVATASTAAVEGAARNSHYGASKGAVTSMVRALAVELARHRIRVNSILPGWIETDMTQRAFNDEKFAERGDATHPDAALGKIDDFGGIAVYLASDARLHDRGAVPDRWRVYEVLTVTRSAAPSLTAAADPASACASRTPRDRP